MKERPGVMILRHKELSFDELRRSYDLKKLACETTETASQMRGMIGQDRAIRAIEFGLGIDSEDVSSHS